MRWNAFFVAVFFFAAQAHASDLAFVSEDGAKKTFDRKAMEKLGVRTVSGYDPYYRKPKKFRAVPLDRLFALAFPGVDLSQKELMFRALDGYSIFVSGSKLLEKGAHVAVQDLEVPGWEPIGPRKDNPGPFYFVWSEAHQKDLKQYPRPWQLASVEIATVEMRYPHIRPVGVDAQSAAMTGYGVFRVQCIQCHAMNQEGGRIGPDLNVPMSIVEYRPEEQVRQYIVNPLRFRYGAMPAHPGLTAAELDGLIAYFHSMKTQKRDPQTAPPEH